MARWTRPDPTLRERRATWWARVRARELPPPASDPTFDAPPGTIRVEAIPPGVGADAIRVCFGEGAWAWWLDEEDWSEERQRRVCEAFARALGGDV